ncbi:SMP-30/gluconolactonase/LRE family protein [Roseibium sp. M-1]
MKLDFELIYPDEGSTQLGESPVWDPATGSLWWVDIEGYALLRADLTSGRVSRWPTPEMPGFVVLAGIEGPAVGMETGIFLFDPATTSFKQLVSLDQPGHRFNDAAVDQSGRLWTSTMSLHANAGEGALHRVTRDYRLTPVFAGLTIPNGLAADLENQRLYFSDSHKDSQVIHSLSLEPDGMAKEPATIFATTKTLAGRPDGAAVDTIGRYWIAGVDGGEIYLFDRLGRLELAIPVPFPAPTKIAFFGEDGMSIAITSKAIGVNGGALALSRLPANCPPGIVQPSWRLPTSRT